MRTICVVACLVTLAGVVACQAQKPSLELQQKLIHSVLQDEIENVKALLAQGADPNARVPFASEDKWWLGERKDQDMTPPVFVVACHFGSIKGPQIIKMLMDKGADVNLADKNGITPLMAASELGFATSLLLERKAKVNVADKHGRTALMYAMGNRGLGVAMDLVKAGADINAQNAGGQTAVMLAIANAQDDPIHLIHDDQVKKARESKERYLELIQFLIDHGANLNVKDKSGNTALSIALSRNRPDAAAILRKAGAK